MYQFTDEEILLINQAKDRAFAIVQRHPFDLHGDGEFSSQFLAREVMRLFREGERVPSHIAEHAVNRLREHIQVKESASRVARSG